MSDLPVHSLEYETPEGKPVRLTTCANEPEAWMIANVLEEHGIPCTICGCHAAAAGLMMQLAPIEIEVSSIHLEKAAGLLSELSNHKQPAALRCEKCGSQAIATDHRVLTNLWRGLLLRDELPAVHTCSQCGRTWTVRK